MRRLFLAFVVLHIAAVLLFTRGFLLSRLSLDNLSSQSQISLQTHKKAVILVIDALRFDFLSPHPPQPQNPHHHNVLTLPAELTKKYPANSFLFNAYADPPTTTLQRIKAITTGSLPTFVDIGSNFGADEILEDSIIKQAILKNKTIAFMGDDTWLSVFPNSFTQAYPYDSFNVEDLHTVDNGVLTHLIPLLSPSPPSSSSSSSSESQQKPDIIIGHFLGVDHVGHRLGPSHPSMYTKLKQMDTSLRQIVNLIETNPEYKDTLLIVLGDHGMDKSGDHGGDGTLETSSAMWVYSPHVPLFDQRREGVFGGLKRYKTFPGELEKARTIQQIDLVPTLSLLLGLEIPFNNLGNVIPEVFWRSSSSSSSSSSTSSSNQKQGSRLALTEAMKKNSEQINKYLNTYRSSSSGNELDGAWESLENTWNTILSFSSSSNSNTNPASSSSASNSNYNNVDAEEEEKILITMMNYNVQALNACRSIWAQFNPLLMGMGLCVMVVGLVCHVLVYLSITKTSQFSSGKGDKEEEEEEEDLLMNGVYKFAIGGSAVGFLVGMSIGKGIGIGKLEMMLFGGIMSGCFSCVVTLLLRLFNHDNDNTTTNINVNQARTQGGMGKWFSLGPIILFLHFLSFFSNSFTFWEEKVVLWLCVTSVIPVIGKAFGAPSISSSPSSSTSSGTGKSTTTTTRTKTKKSWFNLKHIFNIRLGLRDKILLNTFIFLICIRCINLVTICREEQGGYCHITFYSTPSSSSLSPSSSLSLSPLSFNNTTSSSSSFSPIDSPSTAATTTSPTWSIPLSFLISPIFLPLFTSYTLRKTKNDNGITGIVVWGIGLPGLIGSWLVWVLEYLEGLGVDIDIDRGEKRGMGKVVIKMIEEVVRLRSLRSWIARSVFGWVLIGFLIIWVVPFCLDIKVSSPSSSSSITTSSTITSSASASRPSSAAVAASKQVTILGYANALGSPILLFTLLSTILVCLCTPLPGQVVLGLSYVAGICWIEVVDCVKDIEELEDMVLRSISSSSSSPSSSPSSTTTPTTLKQKSNFLTIIPLILLSFITFFGTGHQSIISSIQWKSGFILTENVNYPWSVVTVLLNSFGVFGLLGGCWCGLISYWMGLVLPGSSSSSSSSYSSSTSVSSTSTSSNTSTSTSFHASNVTTATTTTTTTTKTSKTITTTTTLQLQIYFLTLLLGTSTSAAILRRHLMVWKIFAPRWMLAVSLLGIVDFGLVFVVWGFGFGLGLEGKGSGLNKEKEQGMLSKVGGMVPVIGNGMVGRVNEKVGWVLGRVGLGREDGEKGKME